MLDKKERAAIAAYDASHPSSHPSSHPRHGEEDDEFDGEMGRLGGVPGKGATEGAMEGATEGAASREERERAIAKSTRVTIDEFRKLLYDMSVESHLMLDEDVENLFKLFDHDQDGSLDRTDIFQLVCHNSAFLNSSK